MATALMCLVAAAFTLVATRNPTVAVAVVALSLLVALISVLGTERVGFLSLLAAGFFSPMDAVRPGAGGLVTLGDLFYILAFALLVPPRIGRRLELPPGYALGASGVAAMIIVSTLISDNIADSVLSSFRFLFAVVMIPLALALYRPSLARIDLLAWSYVAGQLVNTAYAVTLGGEGQGRLIGLTQHPDYFGMDGAFGCALVLYLVTRPAPGRSLHRLVAWGAGAVCLVSVVLSGSRTAMLAILCLAVLFPIVERSLTALYVLIAGAVIAAVSLASLVALFGPGSAIARLMPGHSVSAYGASQSDEARRQLMSATWKIFKRHPVLGHGLHVADFFTHNVLLQIAADLGIIGLAFFLVLGGSLVRVLFTGGPLHGLGYAAAAYASMTPTTPALWDRNIWAALGLTILATGAHAARRAEETAARVDVPQAPLSAGRRSQLERHR